MGSLPADIQSPALRARIQRNFERQGSLTRAIHGEHRPLTKATFGKIHKDDFELLKNISDEDFRRVFSTGLSRTEFINEIDRQGLVTANPSDFGSRSQKIITHQEHVNQGIIQRIQFAFPQSVINAFSQFKVRQRDNRINSLFEDLDAQADERRGNIRANLRGGGTGTRVKDLDVNRRVPAVSKTSFTAGQRQQVLNDLAEREKLIRDQQRSQKKNLRAGNGIRNLQAASARQKEEDLGQPTLLGG